MEKRTDLQKILEDLIGSKNVYFQPPENVKLNYPCIIYSRTAGETQFANDKPYRNQTGYQVTVIDKNPDSEVLEKVKTLPTCVFVRHYTKDNLNHDIYKIYY